MNSRLLLSPFESRLQWGCGALVLHPALLHARSIARRTRELENELLERRRVETELEARPGSGGARSRGARGAGSAQRRAVAPAVRARDDESAPETAGRRRCSDRHRESPALRPRAGTRAAPRSPRGAAAVAGVPRPRRVQAVQRQRTATRAATKCCARSRRRSTRPSAAAATWSRATAARNSRSCCRASMDDVPASMQNACADASGVWRSRTTPRSSRIASRSAAASRRSTHPHRHARRPAVRGGQGAVPREMPGPQSHRRL